MGLTVTGGVQVKVFSKPCMDLKHSDIYQDLNTYRFMVARGQKDAPVIHIGVHPDLLKFFFRRKGSVEGMEYPPGIVLHPNDSIADGCFVRVAPCGWTKRQHTKKEGPYCACSDWIHIRE